jgi:hypothetical protein
VLGLLGYAIGASAMALAQGLSAVIVLWAVLGGIGASLLLPATVLPPADQQRVAQALEENAQFMSNTQLAQLLVNQPPEIRDEIIRINTESRPLALQVALLIPLPGS